MQWWDYLTVIASFLIVAWFVKVMLTGDGERADEDEARTFFDEHGHWPDEPESLGDWREAREHADARDERPARQP